ncbi:MAG: ABC transporter permease subunit [Anaerolineae bacterium]|nr:ABC transporter permease subunit [Anaerolineae bacterium]
MKNTGVIFKRTLWDSRVGILSWGIGLGILALGELTLFPSISEAFAGMSELLNSPFYKAFLGENADAAAFATPAGYISTYMLAFVPLYVAVYAVMLGLGVVANEEERGTLDVLLGTPIPRWQVIVEKSAAVLVILLLVLLLNGVGALLGVLMTPELADVSLGRVLEASFSMLPVTLVMAALALFFSTVLRSRNLAAGVTGAIIIASYFITNLSSIAQEALGTISKLSFYSYYSPLDTMRGGIVWSEFAILCVIVAALFGLSIYAFQRRDISV